MMGRCIYITDGFLATLKAASSALREQVRCLRKELEADKLNNPPQIHGSVLEIVRTSIEESLQHADLIDGVVNRTVKQKELDNE